MDGAARTGGELTEPYTVGGKTYMLKDPGYLFLMEKAEAYLVGLRPNPFLLASEAVASLPATLSPADRRQRIEHIDRMTERAVLARNQADAEHVGEFLASRSGLIFVLYHYAAEIETPEQAGDIFCQRVKEIGDARALAELQAKIDLVSGLVEAKNSSGPGPKSPGGDEDNPGAFVTA